MPSLESIIPEIEAYQGAQTHNQRQAMGTLAQLVQLSNLRDKQRAYQDSMNMRAEIAALGPDPDPQAASKIAMKYAGSQGLMTHADTQSRIKSNNEATMARLKQTADQFDQRMQLAWNNAFRQEDKDEIEKQWKQGRLNLEATAQRMAGERLFYDTGTRINPAAAPTLGTPQQGVNFNVEGVRGIAPDEQTALAIARRLQGVGGGVPAQAQPPAQEPQEPAPYTPAPPNNLDARDLGAWSRGPVMGTTPVTPTAAPAPSPAAPVIPQMPPEIARAPKKVQDQWLIQQTRGSIAGAGTFTPETLNFTAKQYLTGDRQAVQGFAKNTTARIALQNAIVDEAQKQGLSPEQVAAKIADFQGIVAGSRTVGQRAANISLAATEAQEMLGIVKETSDGFSRTNFVPWNMALRAYESGTGSPEIAKFGAAVNALVNVYARAINPTGVPTVSDKEHARAVLNTVQSPAQVDAVVGIIRRELEIAKKAPVAVREATRSGITGEPASPQPAAPSGWSIRPVR